MTIDSHQHFWQYNPVKDAWITDDMNIIQRDFMPDEFHGLLKQNNIDGCIAVQADQSETETLFLIDLAHTHSFVKGIVGWTDLCSETVEDRLAHFSRSKIVTGFRHIVQAERDPNFLQRKDFCHGISRLEAFNFTYDLLIKPQQLASAFELCKQFPNQKFVVDHLAKPDIRMPHLEPWQTAMAELARCENVHCKISGMVTEAAWHDWQPRDFIPYLDHVFEAFGTDRVMYGSDWPVCLVAATYEEQLSIINTYIKTLSESERRKIMGENAINFYNL